MTQPTKIIPLKKPEAPADDSRLLVTMSVAELKQIVRDEVAAALAKERPSRLTFDTKQAAEILNVPATWLAMKAREGQVPFKRFGHYVRFSMEDIQQIMEAVKTR